MKDRKIDRKKEREEEQEIYEDKMRAMCEDAMQEEKEAYQIREEGEIYA